jgi:ribonuclease T2
MSRPSAAMAIGLLSGFLCCEAALAQSGSCTGEPQGAPGDFDYYLLSLSLAPSFCDTDPEASRRKRECRDGANAAYLANPATVHGLWPNKEGASNDRQPRYCADTPPGRLPDGLFSSLKTYMPGVVDGLEKCEWSKHGVCSGLSYEQYYQAVVDLMTGVESTIGSTLRDNNMIGAEVRLTDIVARIAERDPGLASAITFDCKQARARDGVVSRSYIVEMRVYLSKDLSRATFLPFDSEGGRLNSGCRGGAGYIPSGFDD